MGKIALLVPREEMIHQAHNILQEKKFHIQEMRVIETDSAVIEARRSIADGANIIIARGLQASLIKQYTDIPVVEIVLTAQEMALLIMKGKQIIRKSKPVIAVVGFDNMFCDMSFFDELYDIELRTYFAKQGSELPKVANMAVEDNVDLIIGGDTAVGIAKKSNVPSLFLSMTEDSLKQAFSMAENVEYAINVEKKTAAQMDTLLDYSFNGVIRLNGEGMILAVNPLMEEIIGKEEAGLKGKKIQEIVPQMNEEVLEHVLLEGKEYSLFLEWKHVQTFAVMAPVMFESRVDGVIITFHRIKKKLAPIKKSGNSASSKLFSLVQFNDIMQNSVQMKECVKLARLYALSEQPVVLFGEPGTEKRLLAESIHNSSSRGMGPFIDIPCDGLSAEEQRSLIFGEKGAALQCHQGTLLLHNIDMLSSLNQYRLYQLIRFHNCYGTDVAQTRKSNVRVIVTVTKPLSMLFAEGNIREELYYLLGGLELTIPPLRQRKEDLKQKIDECIMESCERYSRYHVLTNGAKNLLLSYPWKGNIFQIENFCERMILTAGKRSIDEIAVKKLFGELYPLPIKIEEVEQKLLPDNEMAIKIKATLQKYGGNREKTAKELGISKATLWRHMKKYDVET